ncbi:MAG: hypothetical protein SWO11_23740 [Thermodesulfobacteriota bacterium]|nr:hypothetical protein [Thermodesulfobacteriota bacterium]
MKKTALFFYFCFILICTPLYGDSKKSHYESYIDGYLSTAKEQGTSFFYSKGNIEGKMVLLIVEVGSTNGILLEKDDCTIINLANIIYSKEKKQFFLKETHGGVYSYNRVEKILQKLLRQGFYIITPEEFQEKLKEGK